MNNSELINSLYQAFKNRDEKELVHLCAEGIEWHQCAGFPGGGHHIGIQEIIEKVYDGNANRWQSFTFTKNQVLEAGNSVVVVVGSYDVVSHQNKKASAETVHVFEIDKGRVKSFRQFTDTKVLWDCLIF